MKLSKTSLMLLPLLALAGCDNDRDVTPSITYSPAVESRAAEIFSQANPVRDFSVSALLADGTAYFLGDRIIRTADGSYANQGEGHFWPMEGTGLTFFGAYGVDNQQVSWKSGGVRSKV